MNEIVRDESLNVRDAMKQRQMQQTEYNHGDYVPGADGEPGGIYIDQDEVIRQQMENPHIEDIKNYIADMDKRIDAAKKGHIDHNEQTASTKSAEEEVLRKANLNVPEMSDIDKVSKMFAEFEPTANGLAPSNSAEATMFREKMAALESGKVDLSDYKPENLPQNNSPVQQPSVNNVKEEPTLAPVINEDLSSPNTVQFNVDSSNVANFLTTLSPEQMEKVNRSNTIIVNEVKTVDIPTATRTIDDIREFRRVLPRQSHSGTAEVALINSGYTATFKGCGSLAMATLLPDEEGNMDYQKRYQFCYDNLVDTSIGKLTFNEFCARTHMSDLPIMLFTIYRASEPDEGEITLKCAQCSNEYTIKYRISSLLEVDSITDEMYERIQEIVNAKGILETATRIHNESPCRNIKCVHLYNPITGENNYIELAAPSGTKAIEVYPVLRNMVDMHSQFVAGLLPYIHRYVITAADADGVEQKYDIRDIASIAQLIADLPGTCIKALGKILEGIKEYPSPKYSFRGKYKCPKCGREEHRIECSVDSLIFYRVEQAIS